MKLQIRVDENGRICDVKFKTFGCGSAIASSSYMTERVKGLTLDEAAAIKNTDVAKELCLPPVKRICHLYICNPAPLFLLVLTGDIVHCSMLAEDAIKSAIRDYRSKRASVSPTLGPDAIAAAASVGPSVV
jgi:iron-sulfur cluster assembly enzyme ISCU, mitochondrial